MKISTCSNFYSTINLACELHLITIRAVTVATQYQALLQATYIQEKTKKEPKELHAPCCSIPTKSLLLIIIIIIVIINIKPLLILISFLI